jgi:hypothetical protein
LAQSFRPIATAKTNASTSSTRVTLPPSVMARPGDEALFLHFVTLFNKSPMEFPRMSQYTGTHGADWF